MIKTQETTSVEEKRRKKEPLCTVGVKAGSTAAVENSKEVPQKTKSRTFLSSNSTMIFIQRIQKH